MARPCPLNRAQYTEAAEKLEVKLIINGVEYNVEFKEDRDPAQSLGFGINLRDDIEMGGTKVPHMIQVNVTAIGTKNRG